MHHFTSAFIIKHALLGYDASDAPNASDAVFHCSRYL